MLRCSWKWDILCTSPARVRPQDKDNEKKNLFKMSVPKEEPQRRGSQNGNPKGGRPKMGIPKEGVPKRES